jgi:hypothetical protein
MTDRRQQTVRTHGAASQVDARVVAAAGWLFIGVSLPIARRYLVASCGRTRATAG